MSSFSKKLAIILSHYTSNKLMANVYAKVDFYQQKEMTIVSTIVDDIKLNCYTVSPYNMIINYAQDELVKVDSKWQQYFFTIVIKIFSFIFKMVNFDKVQTINNYMLSTNIFSNEFSKVNLNKLTEIAIKKYPEHTLIIRSVNKAQNLQLFNKLSIQGWMPVVSRQVYLVTRAKECQNHRDYQRDNKLLSDEKYSYHSLDVKDFKLFEIAEGLYNQLYLMKYSLHNIHFKALYLQELVKIGILHLRLLYDNKQNQYVGVIGLIGEENTMTVPVVGYELTYSQDEALYRRLIVYAIDYAMQNKFVLNLSSGAPQFKTNRGAKSHIEYMFIYTKHLPVYKRLVWKMMYLVSNHIYKRVLQKLKL